MGLTTEDYLQHLQALLPQGPAWPREPDALLTLELTAFAEEFARIDQRADDLVEEADPRTTYELLSDWERICGLPDGCTGPLSGVAARRAAVVARLTTLGAQNAAYFISIAAALGYTITITEEAVHTCLSVCTDPINGQEWRFVWNVNVSQANTVRDLTCIDECTTPLAVWGDQLLECAISRLKPAHTLVRFIYS